MTRAAQASRIQDGIAGTIDGRSADMARTARRLRIAAKGRKVCDEALEGASADDVLSILKAIVREACARIKAMIGTTDFAGFWGSLGSTYVAPKGSAKRTPQEADDELKRVFKTGEGA